MNHSGVDDIFFAMTYSKKGQNFPEIVLTQKYDKNTQKDEFLGK